MRATLAMSLSWAISTGRFIPAPLRPAVCPLLLSPAGTLTVPPQREVSSIAAWLIAGACICTLRSLGFRLAAQERSAGDLVSGQGILPVLSFAQGRDVEQIQRAVNAPHRVDPLPGSLDGVLPERELVELPDTIPAALAKRVEEFEGFDQMHRADDEVVVPAPEVV